VDKNQLTKRLNAGKNLEQSGKLIDNT
jgi:hypothetical protein